MHGNLFENITDVFTLFAVVNCSAVQPFPLSVSGAPRLIVDVVFAVFIVKLEFAK